jgi:hypothetical protein
MSRQRLCKQVPAETIIELVSKQHIGKHITI